MNEEQYLRLPRSSIRKGFSLKSIIHLQAADGAQLSVRHWGPLNQQPERSIVMLHGLITHSGWFDFLGEELARLGFAVYAPDRRGNGLTQHLSDIGNVDLLMDDVKRVLNFVTSRDSNTTLFCWCWGAKLGIPLANELPIRGLVLASPALASNPAVGKRFQSGVAVNGWLPLHFDPLTDFSKKPEARRFIEQDSYHLRQVPEVMRPATASLNALCLEALPSLRIPILTFMADDDDIIDVPQTAKLVQHSQIEYFHGGHGFVVEPDGPEFIARGIKQATATW